jgi:hypothetical protein
MEVSGQLYSLGKNRWYQFNRRLGSRAGLCAVKKRETLPLPGISNKII